LIHDVSFLLKQISLKYISIFCLQAFFFQKIKILKLNGRKMSERYRSSLKKEEKALNY